MQSKTFAKPVLGAFGVLALIGVACWVYAPAPTDSQSAKKCLASPVVK